MKSNGFQKNKNYFAEKNKITNFAHAIIEDTLRRRDGRVVDCGGLENR